ncbi:MAG: family 20 glycosylhydrolase [Oscillospiraceae bacterium]|nr:family 20 glycosylhydrolase [Oscillospiraceae bacterium]
MIFPRPAKQELLSGTYALKEDYTTFELVSFYNAIKDGKCEISYAKNALLSNEEYYLSVNDNGIELTAACDCGLFRGATSLLQLIKKHRGIIPCLYIEDKPEISRRGYMLDISRCRMPKLETYKKLIDFLSSLKYNELQIYMEGDCFKYSAYPKYTEDFDCLTASDIKELEVYCRERFIDLVPNQNSFGHLAIWLNKEEFSHLEIRNETTKTGTINPLLPESFEFIGNLYESLLPVFDSEYVNIGLDEAGGLGKFQVEEYCRKNGRGTLFMEWLNKLAALVKEKYGKKVMFWADMIYKYPELYNLIPRDSVIMEWGYELIQSQMMTDHAMTFRDAGLNYYVCPSCNTHKSFVGRMDVTTFNIRTSAEIATKYGAKGILLTDWGCGEGHPHFGVWSYVPIALCGQYGWNTGAEQDGETFKADFIRNSEDYVDEFFFGGVKVARFMYRMANYYLLEPERVHVGTMCGAMFQYPITQTNYAYLYDMADSGDAFYFDNVIGYVEKILPDIEKLDFDEQHKREIILNSKMIILAAEMNKLRIGVSLREERVRELLTLSEYIEKEYYDLWCRRNYEKGVELFLSFVADRKKDLQNLLK